MNITKVKLGLTSIVGYLTMAGGALPIVIKTLDEGNAALGKPEAALALLAIVVGGVTTLVRGWQAQAKVKAHAENPNVRDTL
jgi:hypothetical protein